MIKNVINKISIYILLALGVILILFPMYITVITALKTPQESAQNFFALPHGLYLDNFQKIIMKAHYGRYFLNSFLITITSLIGELLVVPLFAYSVSRNMQKPLYKIMYTLTIFGIFVPFQAVMLPTIKLLSNLSLLNILGLILLYVTYTFKKGAFLFVGFLQSIPKELEESAFIDGCTLTQSFMRIIFPLLQPMIATMIVIDGLWIWNDFLLPLLVLNKDSMSWTLQLFQFQFKNQYSFDFNLAFASFLMSMLPMIVLYLFMQRFIISGITKGAVKG